jgi:tetratricopeptide (TPR) repeat protein
MEAETKQTAPAAQSFDVYTWAAWAYAHRKPLLAGLTAVAVVFIAVALYNFKKEGDELDANQQFFKLPSMFAAAGEKAPPLSATQLEAIANAYPGSSMGLQAQLLAAQTLFTQGKYPEARTWFLKSLAEHGTSLLACQASIGVAACDEALGQTATAIEEYKKVLSQSGATEATTPIKLTLARLFEEQKQYDQALSYYNELASAPVSAYDPWGAEARERRLVLLAQHPELSKSIAPTLMSPAPSLAAPAPAPAGAPKPK